MNRIGEILAAVLVGTSVTCAAIYVLRRRHSKRGMTFRELMDDNVCAADISLF